MTYTVLMWRKTQKQANKQAPLFKKTASYCHDLSGGAGFLFSFSVNLYGNLYG
jgi:hypothetical protein